MKRFRYINAPPSLFMVLFLLVLILFVPATAFGWGGSAHLYATEQAAQLFLPENHDNISDQIPHSPNIIERDTKTPLFPELSSGLSHAWYEGSEPFHSDSHDYNNWEILKWNGAKEDDYELIDWTQVWKPSPIPADYPPLFVDVTVTHFWQPAFFGALGETLGATKLCTETYPNAWVKAKILWNAALWWWRTAPEDPEGKAFNLGLAYTYLGHVVHLVEDMGEPAHTHQDLHANCSEKFECWLGDGPLQANLSWFKPDSIGAGGVGLNTDSRAVIPKVPEFGDILYPPDNQAEILGTANSVHYSSSDCYPNISDDTLANDEDLFPDLHPEFAQNNLPQLFYLMFVTNMIGDYCPSSGGDGQTDDKTGWLGGYGDTELFPRFDADGNDFKASARLDDNETYFNQLTQVCYKASFQVAHSVIDLFRRTVDNMPPDTTVDMPGPNGSNGWYKSPFTVKLTGATDHGRRVDNAEYRPSGVWKVWGLYDGTPPTGENPLSWYIHEDGDHHIINCLSTDMAGNVDTRDIIFKYDGTPPVITFPGLKPNYLTSESFTVKWNATDATSGVDVGSVKVYLDGQQVNSGQVFNLSQMVSGNSFISCHVFFFLLPSFQLHNRYRLPLSLA